MHMNMYTVTWSRSTRLQFRQEMLEPKSPVPYVRVPHYLLLQQSQELGERMWVIQLKNIVPKHCLSCWPATVTCLCVQHLSITAAQHTQMYSLVAGSQASAQIPCMASAWAGLPPRCHSTPSLLGLTSAPVPSWWLSVPLHTERWRGCGGHSEMQEAFKVKISHKIFSNFAI